MDEIKEIFAADSKFFADTDSKTIQNAVDEAERTGVNRVVINRFNPRTGKNIWIFEEAVILPSNMTIVINDAHLRLGDGVFDNIFRNKNCLTEIGNTMEGEQNNIRIIGFGNALLDGGKLNGLCEQMHRDNPEKYPRLSVNLLIFLHNVRDFTISGLNIIESRWWSICCIYCRFGKISDIDFKMYATAENQDGIDLRIGCEYITIQNITGITGDDTVALTALPNDDLVPETSLHVEGKSFDIHDITIRDITSSSHGNHVLRFLCEDGAKEYNVTVDNVKDTGLTISSCVIIFGIGNTYFVKDSPRKLGDFRNFRIRNISTNAQKALMFVEPMQDVSIENIDVYGQSEAGLRFAKNFYADNVTVKNFNVRADEETFDTVFSFQTDIPKEALEGLKITDVNVDSTNYVFRQNEVEIENLKVKKIKKDRRIDENYTFPSAYGRYHRCAFGKEITNRPKDNRFDNNTK